MFIRKYLSISLRMNMSRSKATKSSSRRCSAVTALRVAKGCFGWHTSTIRSERNGRMLTSGDGVG